MELFDYFLILCGIIVAAIPIFASEKSRRERAREKDAPKNAMKESLLNTIDRNNELVAKGSEKKGPYQHKAFRHQLHRISFENCLTSDTYLEFSQREQNKIEEYYNLIMRLNKLTRQLPAGGVATKIQKIDRAQVPLLNELFEISAELKTILAE
jgi:hypothetical protein